MIPCTAPKCVERQQQQQLQLRHGCCCLYDGVEQWSFVKQLQIPYLVQSVYVVATSPVVPSKGILSFLFCFDSWPLLLLCLFLYPRRVRMFGLRASCFGMLCACLGAFGSGDS